VNEYFLSNHWGFRESRYKSQPWWCPLAVYFCWNCKKINTNNYVSRYVDFTTAFFVRIEKWECFLLDFIFIKYQMGSRFKYHGLVLHQFLVFRFTIFADHFRKIKLPTYVRLASTDNCSGYMLDMVITIIHRQLIELTNFSYTSIIVLR